jgi:FkbM family methyltransferase
MAVSSFLGREPTTRGDRLCLTFLRHAPQRLVELVAGALARAKPLAPEPGWYFDVAAHDASPRVRFRRDLWEYYRVRRIERPVTLRWHDGLKVRAFLGNDMSLCLYVGGSFEPNEFVFLRSVLRPGMVFLDGGANDGLYSLFAARQLGPDGIVIAVEPSEREYERLVANLSVNRLATVRPQKVALGKEQGTGTLAIAEQGHEGQNTMGTSVSNPTVETTRHESVVVDTIDELVIREELTRLDFLKLDVEGSEVDVLEGARETIGRFRPLMLLEAEDERLASQRRTKEDFVRLVTAFGYKLWVFDRDSGQLRPARRPLEPEGNVIAGPATWTPPTI